MRQKLLHLKNSQQGHVTEMLHVTTLFFFQFYLFNYFLFFALSVYRPLDYQKISHACRQMLEWLDENVPLLENEAIKVKTILETKASPKPIETKYDIFISYSHRNKVNADKIHKYVSALHPDWKIFIDTEGLRTGDSWQPKLYSCIGK